MSCRTPGFKPPHLRERLNERDFDYDYIEPGVDYELNERWEWTLGVRFGDSIRRVRPYE
jgi:hypothetical protein